MSNIYGPRATIRRAKRFYPAHEVSLILICCRNGKNDRFVSIRCDFQALKYAKTRFLPGSTPDPAASSPRSHRWLGSGTPPPHSLPPRRHLDLGALSCLAPTSLKFVHLALRSKRLDTPDLVSRLSLSITSDLCLLI